jgi:hypothetical protein
VREAAQAQGYPHQDIVSGTGHDAVYLARVAPSAMIFVPCVGGISHNEIEDAKPDDLTAGCNVSPARHCLTSRVPSTAQRSSACHPLWSGRLHIGMAGIRSESVADFPRNTHNIVTTRRGVGRSASSNPTQECE